MKLLLLLFKQGGPRLVIASLASILSGASSAGLIAVINVALLQLPDIQPNLFPVFVGLCLALWLFQFVSWVLIVRLSQGVIRDLRIQTTQRILEAPLQHLESLGASKLLATLLEDINAISTASTSLALLVVNVAILVGVCGYLCWLSPLLFVAILISIVLGFSLYSLLQRPGLKSFKKARETSDVLFGHFRSVTEGTKELKLNRQRRLAFIEEDVKVSANRSMYYWNKAITSFALAGSSGIVMVFIPIGWLLFFLSQSEPELTALVPSYVLAILYLFTPLGEITNGLPEIARASVALNKVEALGLSLSQQVVEPEQPIESAFAEDWSAIKLSNIHHVYTTESDNHSFALESIDLTIRRGEIAFIVGGNGSGKSTLAKLITGLYLPDSGSLSVDERAVSDQNREWYRQLFSAVFYDFYLFSRFLGIDDSQLPEVQRYLAQLELTEKVSVSNGVLSTVDLSQGQRKRLALLTAYLEDRPIYVFDEWASDQDPIFKAVFYKELLPNLRRKGKTVIAISHDDRYFDNCDHLIRIEFGQIVADSDAS